MGVPIRKDHLQDLGYMRRLEEKYLRNGLGINFSKTKNIATKEKAMRHLQVKEVFGTHNH